MQSKGIGVSGINYMKKQYEQIDAPEKKFFIFENAAHSPIYEEAEKAGEYLQEILYS